MNFSRTIASILLLSAAVDLASLTGSPQAEKRNDLPQKGGRMSPQQEPLPFNLTSSDLKNVEILYAFYSAKTGAGKQEITITGTGKIKLLLTRSYSSPPEVREGTVSPELASRLLDFIAGENFLTLNDRYPSHDAPHARRVIRLTLPDGGKTVLVDEPICPEFERIAGAVKFVAGVGLPEALHQQFFPNL